MMLAAPVSNYENQVMRRFNDLADDIAISRHGLHLHCP